MSERLEKGIVDQELSEASLKFLDRRSCKEVKGIHPVPESREKKIKDFRDVVSIHPRSFRTKERRQSSRGCVNPADSELPKQAAHWLRIG
jgi:hypothetical protein